MPIGRSGSCDLASFAFGASLAVRVGMRSSWIVFAVVAARVAHADVSEPTVEMPVTIPDEPDEPDSGGVTTSYRATTIAVDAASIAVMIGANELHVHAPGQDHAAGTLLAIGALGGLLADPFIHAGRGHGSRGVASFLLRDGAMGVGMLIGVLTVQCKPNDLFCPLEGLDRRAAPGMIGGLAVAALVDAIWFTDETVPRSTTAWTPVVAPTQGGGTFGVAAAF